MASKATALFLTFNILFLSLFASNPASAQLATCPKDTLAITACANVLGLVTVGSPTRCCTLINGLTDLQAAVCLCTALKASVLGIDLNVRLRLTALLNGCGHSYPSGYVCA